METDVTVPVKLEPVAAQTRYGALSDGKSCDDVPEPPPTKPSKTGLGAAAGIPYLQRERPRHSVQGTHTQRKPREESEFKEVPFRLAENIPAWGPLDQKPPRKIPPPEKPK